MLINFPGDVKNNIVLWQCQSLLKEKDICCIIGSGCHDDAPVVSLQWYKLQCVGFLVEVGTR